jgi:phospholipase/lecithinase/hemolysin
MKKLLALLFSLALSTGALATNFSEVVILGDSLSDNGNLYKASINLIPKSPPYYAGRFTNGPNWADYVSNYYQVQYHRFTQNFAYGGATAILHDSKDDDFIAPMTLDGELYKYYIQSSLDNLFKDKSKILYGIWIGANDYLYDRQIDIEKLTDSVVNRTTWAMEELIKQGAKNFLIFNQPDLGRIPYAKTHNLVERLHTVASTHNQKLANVIESIKLKYPLVKVVYIDIYTLFNDTLDNTEKYNQTYHLAIQNKSDSCWSGGLLFNNKKLTANIISNELQNTFKSMGMQEQAICTNKDIIMHSPTLLSAYQLDQAYQAGLQPCKDPDAYIFWDDIHPTAVVHKILGQFVVQAIEKNL